MSPPPGHPHPKFVIAGAPRSGTTSLYQYLQDHPDIFMPEEKEPRFFSFRSSPAKFRGPGIRHWRHDIVDDDASYLALFRQVLPEVMTGEASSDYLYLQGSFAEMRMWNPAMKIVLVLRDPVDRAYSNYRYLRGAGLERLSFREGVRAEPDRIARSWAPIWHYVQRGFYGRQVESLLESFPSDQVHIELFEDLAKGAEESVRRVIAFLGLPPVPIDCSAVFNESVEPRSALSGRVRRVLRSAVPYQKALLHRIEKILPVYNRVTTTKQAPGIEPSAKLDLAEIYAADCQRLLSLLNSTGWESVASRIPGCWTQAAGTGSAPCGQPVDGL